MAVPKKRVPIPENAVEFWEWAEEQTSLAASLVFVVKDYIARHGGGDAICAYSFDNKEEKRGRKPKNADAAVHATNAGKERTAIIHQTAVSAEVNTADESAAVTTEGFKSDFDKGDTHVPVTNTYSEPMNEQTVAKAESVQSVAVQPTVSVEDVSAEDNTTSILAQLGGNSNSSDANSDDASEMLASMLNI